MSPQGRNHRFARRVAVLLGAAALMILLPTMAAAHPLGNFTINHYAGLRVSTDQIALDVVIDHAEIPAFQERSRIDADGNGTLSAAEIEAERVAACPRLAADLSLTSGGAEVVLVPTAAGLAFPLGTTGVATMRLVCEYAAALSTPVAAPTSVRFEDRSWPDRIGWREIVVAGSGTIVTSSLPSISTSQRLTAYPTDLLSQPLDVRVAAFTVRAGGPALPPWSAADASGVAVPDPATGADPRRPSSDPSVGAAAVPGGVAGEISGLLGASDLTPVVLLVSFLTAIALGAGHALTPGHGKTIMAAYLVGTRGSARHAVGLGLATAVSHTIGVLLLALLIVLAGAALPADRVYPILAAASGVIVLTIGAWLVAGQVTRWLRVWRRPTVALAGAGGRVAGPFSDPGQGFGRVGAHGHAADHGHGHGLGHGHGHGHETDHRPEPARTVVVGSAGARFGERHAVRALNGAGAGAGMAMSTQTPGPAAVHRHGLWSHSHLPSSDQGERGLSWRTLFALGLSGGLVPSTNALLILVATVAAGRAPYGMVLVVAFGLGMAAVLVGVGLALVYASDLLARAPRSAAVGRVLVAAPAVAAVAVLALGLVLTAQAIGGSAVF